MPSTARGLEDVVVGATRLSRVDGEAGRLVIGGFPIEELAPAASYEEVLFLLWHDRLPSRSDLAGLREEMAGLRTLSDGTLAALRAAAGARLDPMDALRIGVSTLLLANPELGRVELQREPALANRARALAIVAALPVLVAAYHRLCHGREPIAADSRLGHAASFLWLLGGARAHPARVRALETYLNTAIDHGMNASTFAARVIVSTRSDLVSAVTGAVGALKGPLHGGAPGPALDMVVEVRARSRASGRSLDDVAEEWVRTALRDGGRIMGFGHRVYRVRDPRADVLGEALETLAASVGADGILSDGRTVELATLRVLHEHKPGRRIDTNVEFYTALLLHSLGLPPSLFSPTFAVARAGGWTAHLLEQIEEDRLIRPSVAYRGGADRRFVPLERRAEAGAAA
jgi:citrate synthase